MSTRDTSRKTALKRSHKALQRALRFFCTLPASAERAAIEHALDAVQRAHLLADPPQSRRDDVRRWEDAWIAAYLELHAIAKRRGEL